MKTHLKLEEFAMFAAAYIGTLMIGFDWWVFWAFLLAPDIGMLGYLVNTKTGAAVYNLFHSKLLGILLAVIGLYLIENSILAFSGMLIFGHSSMDRIFGYGLKYSDSFKNTHLGKLK
jgi:hypothetical protein